MSRAVLSLVVAGSILTQTGRAAARPRQAQDPLAPLGRIATALEQAVGPLLRGRTASRRSRIQTQIRPQALQALRQAGVRSAQLVGFEFELLLYQGQRATYYLRTFVHSGKGGVVLMGLTGRAPTSGKLYVSGHPIGTFTGVTAPFRLAAQALLRSAATPSCIRIPVATVADAARLGLTGRLLKRFLRDSVKTRQVRGTICADLARLAGHRVHIRIDDAAFAARDGRGRFVGLIKADLEKRGSQLQLTVRGFRALRP